MICIPLCIQADEQWSYVGKKRHQRWLWLAFGHYTHEVIGYCFGARTDRTLNRLLHLLQPYPVAQWFTDGLSVSAMV